MSPSYCREWMKPWTVCWLRCAQAGACGSAVAFKLAWALCKKHCGSPKVTPQLRDFLLDAVALAALGTVADVVPLFEENRIFVRHGLARLKDRPTLGLLALLKAAKIAG